MLNTKNLRQTTWGNFLSIGGPPNDIIPLQYSLYNFGGINSTELLDTGDSEIFQYLLVTKDNYLLARSKNIVIHLTEYKGQAGEIPWNIAMNRATEELNSIKEEPFLKINSISDNFTYSVGHYDRDLAEINTKYSEVLGNLNLVVDKG